MIKQRGDTASNWTSVNPVLGQRQVGWETDTRRSKLGDGTTAWNALPYTSSGGTTISKGFIIAMATAL